MFPSTVRAAQALGPRRSNLLPFVLILVLAVVSAPALLSCGGDGGGGTEPPDDTPRLTTILITPNSGSLDTQGQTLQLAAQGLDQFGAGMSGFTFTWASSRTDVATVNGSGLVTAVADGSASITATAGGKTGSSSISVDIDVASVEVVPASAALSEVGETVQLAASAKDKGGAVIGGANFTWASSDNGVATVSADGLVTAAGSGSAEITATAKGTSGTADVTVAIEIASVAVEPDTLLLTYLGETSDLSGEARDGSGTPIPGVSLTWLSRDPSVVTVDDQGGVEAVGVGLTFVTAGTGSFADSVRVRVVQVPATVAVTPDEHEFHAVGDTRQFEASVLDAGGRQVPGIGVSWSVGDPGVASVDEDGLVTANAGGSTTLTASVPDGPEGSASLSVWQVPATLELSPSEVLFSAVGDTLTVLVSATDSNGVDIPDLDLLWVSRDEEVVTVSQDGKLTAVGDGATAVIGGMGMAMMLADSVEVVVATADATYSGEPVMATTGADGKVVIATESFDGYIIELTVQNPAGQPQAGMEVEYGEVDGNVVVSVIDPTGNNVPALLYGDPDSLVAALDGAVEYGPQRIVADGGVAVSIDVTTLTAAQVATVQHAYRLLQFYLQTNLSGLELCVTYRQIAEFAVQLRALGFDTAPIALTFASAVGGIPSHVEDAIVFGPEFFALGVEEMAQRLIDVGEDVFDMPTGQTIDDPALVQVTAIEEVSPGAPFLHIWASILVVPDAPQCAVTPNDPPEVVITPPAGTQSDDVTIAIEVTDGEGDSNDFLVTVAAPEFPAGRPAALTETSVGTVETVAGNTVLRDIPPGSHTFVWNSAADYDGMSTEEMRVILTWVDPAMPTNVRVFTSIPFSVDNTDDTSFLGTGFDLDQFSEIPVGTFQMGSTNGEADERPVHTVELTEPFLMQRTEVTQAQWFEVTGTNPSIEFAGCDRCPVERVTWIDIQNFLLLLNSLDPGHNYRLPTEAEWEYAARAGTTGDYGGTGVLDDMGWYADNSDARTHVVATKLPNAWGLYDMHGNVAEWVNDWYSATYYDESPGVNPEGPTVPGDPAVRVIRGGNWFAMARFSRSAERLAGFPESGGRTTGFRLVRDVPK